MGRRSNLLHQIEVLRETLVVPRNMKYLLFIHFIHLIFQPVGNGAEFQGKEKVFLLWTLVCTFYTPHLVLYLRNM